MFIAAIFTIATAWKSPRCPLRDELIKKLWYIYAIEYYLVIKRNEIIPFAKTWIDLEIFTLSEIHQTNTNYHMISLKCGILKKNGTNELVYRTEIHSQKEDKLMATKGDRWSGKERSIKSLGLTHIHYYI